MSPRLFCFIQRTIEKMYSQIITISALHCIMDVIFCIAYVIECSISPALHRKSRAHRARPKSPKKSRPADMCGWTGHNQGNLAQRVCEAARPSARFGAKFCPQGDIRDCEAEARPADETAEAEQGQRSAFCKRASARAVKTGHRNQEDFCRATARRNGFPLKYF